MTNERYDAVSNDDKSKLTLNELAQGWHFCWEFDGLLVGPGMDEQKYCCAACGPAAHEAAIKRRTGTV